LITASGGPFRDVSVEKLKNVNKNDALKHPNWKMGAKITVDSATMMNKAFEVIEAKWLFKVDWNQIEVVIHPESIIHSMVEFQDGVTKAQLSIPDMRLPIQHALFYPERMKSTESTRFRPTDIKQLTFRKIDQERYPCFDMAIDYAKRGGTWPSALCGADEGAVDKFLEGCISFVEIESVIRQVMELHNPCTNPNLTQILDASAWAKKEVGKLVGTKPGIPL
jgi:1-deoxy-D-xylulose-5-phosphate reductoisomerase